MSLEKQKHIERAILQCVIENDGSITNAKCKPEDFKIKDNKEIFQAMLDIEAEGKKANDLVLLEIKLSPTAFTQLNVITNGDHYGMFQPSMLPNYLKELRILNKTSIVADVIGEHGINDPGLVNQKIEEYLSAQCEKEENDGPKILSEVFDEIEFLSRNKGKLPGLSFGYPSLDWKTYGLKKGEVYVLAARPSIGKSLFALNVACNVASNGGHVLINALEETKKNIYKRLISHISKVRLHDIMMGQINDKDWTPVLSAIETINSLNITILDETGLTGSQIATNISRTHARKSVDLVIVDHLQEVADKSYNRHLAISEALASLKSVVKRLEIPLICVSQINRNVETRKPPRPLMSDLKESGDIEAKADVVMLLYRESYYDPTAGSCMEIIIAKARNGMCGIVPLNFDGATMTISE